MSYDMIRRIHIEDNTNDQSLNKSKLSSGTVNYKLFVNSTPGKYRENNEIKLVSKISTFTINGFSGSLVGVLWEFIDKETSWRK